MYLYGSGFQTPMQDFHWDFAAFMAEQLDAVVSIIPYPLCPTNHGLEASSIAHVTQKVILIVVQ
jgi:acetyl esterase/lipase